MIEQLETLETLREYKTMLKTATAMRLTQSSISKRIANLEFITQKKLIEKNGRRVTLTHDALVLLEKTRPCIIGIKQALQEELTINQSKINIGFSESILSSWGPRVIKDLQKKIKHIQIIPHTHRSPVVIDRVRSGEYSFGLCAGHCVKAIDLHVKEIAKEIMVHVKNKNSQNLMSIEEKSETWQSIYSQAKREKCIPNCTLESFGPIIELANHGLVNAIVPSGVARFFLKSKQSGSALKVQRPIILIARKTVFSRTSLQSLISSIIEISSREVEACNRYFFKE